MIDVAARDAMRKTSVTAVQQSFCITHFSDSFIQEIQSLLLDDVHLNDIEIKRRGWEAIHADGNSGAIDIESQALVDWWKAHEISPVYATSRQRLVEHNDNKVLVMKLTEINSSMLNVIDLGAWMFGKIPDLAAQRIPDWRADVWFSDPLRFIVVWEHGGYGTTTIAGPVELIEAVRARATHDDYEWKAGVVPESNKGQLWEK